MIYGGVLQSTAFHVIASLIIILFFCAFECATAPCFVSDSVAAATELLMNEAHLWLSSKVYQTVNPI